MVPTLESIPVELRTEIVARVAALSSDDLFNVSLSCKKLNKDANDEHVYRNVSLKKFPVVLWKPSKQISFFLDRCAKSGNPEAMYRRGVVAYFGNMEMKNGIECLQRAANCGHQGAFYAIGIILLLHGGEYQEEGMKMISGMKKIKNARQKLLQCRKKLTSILSSVWKINHVLVAERARCCTTHHGRSRGWLRFEDVDLECDACTCDQEIASIVE